MDVAFESVYPLLGLEYRTCFFYFLFLRIEILIKFFYFVELGGGGGGGFHELGTLTGCLFLVFGAIF